jgi:hypothetical protein
MRSALFRQVGRVLSTVGRENVLILCVFVFDTLIVNWSPQDITGVQAEVLASYPHQGQEAFCVWELNCKLGQLCSLSLSALPEQHLFP